MGFFFTKVRSLGKNVQNLNIFKGFLCLQTRLALYCLVFLQYYIKKNRLHPALRAKAYFTQLAEQSMQRLVQLNNGASNINPSTCNLLHHNSNSLELDVSNIGMLKTEDFAKRKKKKKETNNHSLSIC